MKVKLIRFPGFSFLFFAIILLSNSANAQEYEVTQSKMDSVLSNSSPGDTIVLANGTYTDIVLNLKSSGTKNNPIVLKASTIGRVIFTGPLSRVSVRASYCVIDGFRWEDIQSTQAKAIVQFTESSNNVFRNNTILNSGRITPGSATGALRLMTYSRNNIIEYNRFENLLNLGIQVWAWDSDTSNTGNIIRYNHFVNHKMNEMIQLGQGGSSAFVNQHSVVEYNLFEDIIMEDPELISSKSSFNIFRGNTFRNCRSMLVLRTGQNALVEGNWFLKSHGIRVHDKNHLIINNYIEGVPPNDASTDNEGIVLYCGNQFRPEIGDKHFPADSVLVANNTIINHMAEHILIGRNSTRPYLPTSVSVINNLVVNNTGTAILNEASINSVWKKNMVFASGSGTVGNAENLIMADPMLIMEGEMYKIGYGSPAIDAATSEVPVTIDMEGQTRNIIDIGADEYSSDIILHQPLDSTMVGPGNEKPVIPTMITKMNNGNLTGTLFQNYPNPFSDFSTIEFENTRAGNVLVELFDINGRKISTLIDKYLPEGKYSFTWKLVDKLPMRDIMSGIYFYILKTPDCEQWSKVLYLKQ